MPQRPDPPDFGRDRVSLPRNQHTEAWEKHRGVGTSGNSRSRIYFDESKMMRSVGLNGLRVRMKSFLTSRPVTPGIDQLPDFYTPLESRILPPLSNPGRWGPS